MSARKRTVLAIVATDATFSRVPHAGAYAWRGKCLHCRRWLLIADDGTPISNATIEHILPRTHGGDDRAENLGLACAGCNHEKGRRHDRRKRGDRGLERLIEALRAERTRRWRDEPGDLGRAGY